MKFTLVTVILLLLSTLFAGGSSSGNRIPATMQASPDQPAPAQTPLQLTDLEKIRRKFAQLDANDEDSKIETSIKGNDESSGKLTITTESAAVAYIAETEIFEVDLSVITIPDTFIIPTIVAIFSNPNPRGSLEGVKVKQLGASGQYEVVEEYSYQNTAFKITVPKGFVYDRASIPRVFWILIDKDSLSNVAPLFHDLLYRYGGRLPQSHVSPYRTFTREEADRLFLELMTKCGVISWRRKAAYEAVRNLAGSHWNNR